MARSWPRRVVRFGAAPQCRCAANLVVHLHGGRILIAHTRGGAREQVGAWKVGEELRLVLGEEMTEWITIESGARVIDEAVEITAAFIVDLETSEVRAAQRLRGLPNFVGRGQVRELPRRV